MNLSLLNQAEGGGWSLQIDNDCVTRDAASGSKSAALLRRNSPYYQGGERKGAVSRRTAGKHESARNICAVAGQLMSSAHRSLWEARYSLLR